MNFTNKHKLYFNVILLFIFSYLLTAKIIEGIKTQEFNYLRIGINALFVILTIKSITKYNKED